MEQKHVSLEVAKAIKEAGYPQRRTDSAYLLQTISNFKKEYEYGKLVANQRSFPQDATADTPTYLDVWLWLWRDKEIRIDIDYCINKCTIFDNTQEVIYSRNFIDPEDSIIEAIEYLVKHELI